MTPVSFEIFENKYQQFIELMEKHGFMNFLEPEPKYRLSKDPVR